jgi:hypothetical protein
MLAKRKAEEPVRRRRERGHPSKMTGFRCPLELLEAADAEEAVQAQGLIALLDRAVDAKREMGKEWSEVMTLAFRENITEGEALGRLAMEALGRDKKKR